MLCWWWIMYVWYFGSHEGVTMIFGYRKCRAFIRDTVTAMTIFELLTLLPHSLIGHWENTSLYKLESELNGCLCNANCNKWLQRNWIIHNLWHSFYTATLLKTTSDAIKNYSNQSDFLAIIFCNHISTIFIRLYYRPCSVI